ncbi:MAG: D-alanyl-D-alanine carboxypeptidase [Clostridia bacterium]|nr:D-alanyl-D-alanine carboxypeptidase [Clostridia bacterium]
MRRRLGWLLVICYVFVLLVPQMVLAMPETAEEIEAEPVPMTDAQGRPILFAGETGIVIDQTSGAVLYEWDCQKRMFPASCTKVMTCLLAVEAVERGEISMEEPVTITAEMLEGLDIDGSNMALKEGEVLEFRHLLWGLMVPSGNDAAMAIAFRLAGSQELFAERMNARAQELGLKETHFVNPHGLHDDNHYTTAADMAKIAYVAMKNEDFRNIVDIAHVKIPPTNMTEKERYYLNTNGLLSGMRYSWYVYKGATGIKTGRTTEAGNCLVSSATRGGMSLIGVLFGGADVGASHEESARMLDYGFENFQPVRGIAKGELLGESKVKYAKRKDTVTLAAATDVMAVVPKGVAKDALEIRLNLPEKVYAPIKEGAAVASATVLYQGQELGETPLLALVAVKRSFFWPIMALGDWLWGFLLVRIVVYLVLIALVIFLLLVLRTVWLEMQRIYRKKKS